MKDRYAGENPLSARQFAEALGARGYRVSHTTVLAYESNEGGTDKVPASYLAAVSAAFDINPTWLLTGEGGPRPIEPERAVEAMAVIAQIVAAVHAGVRVVPAASLPATDTILRLSSG